MGFEAVSPLVSGRDSGMGAVPVEQCAPGGFLGTWGAGLGKRKVEWESLLLSITLKISSCPNSAVSTFTNAFAITQFFGVLCAPWNGMLMDRLKQKFQKEAKKTGEAGS